MNYEPTKRERIQRSMDDALYLCQDGVMATVELELHDSPHWKNIRSRLLRFFGDRGLAGRLSEILDAELGRAE